MVIIGTKYSIFVNFDRKISDFSSTKFSIPFPKVLNFDFFFNRFVSYFYLTFIFKNNFECFESFIILYIFIVCTTYILYKSCMYLCNFIYEKLYYFHLFRHQCLIKE